jgi:hypothetical protein
MGEKVETLFCILGAVELISIALGKLSRTLSQSVEHFRSFLAFCVIAARQFLSVPDNDMWGMRQSGTRLVNFSWVIAAVE